ncbi:MAG: PilZ domain-containing protein [Firmicutes bacterium]|nr:PilZ domain-containing protein [Bacillota bacterium]
MPSAKQYPAQMMPAVGDWIRVQTDQGIFPSRVFAVDHTHLDCQLVPAYLAPHQRLLISYRRGNESWRLPVDVIDTVHRQGIMSLRVKGQAHRADARYHPRYTLPLSAETLGSPDERTSVQVTDLSLGGCRILASHPYPMGLHLVLRLQGPTDTLSLPSEVVWQQRDIAADERYAVGLMFVNLASPDRAVLESWLS